MSPNKLNDQRIATQRSRHEVQKAGIYNYLPINYSLQSLLAEMTL